jgi:predicted nucleic acid-binding protein
LIAATALVYELELLTVNQKDFRIIPELALCD